MRSENQPAIEVRGLSKRFGDVEAVKDVHFAVEAGEIFGFMGHNGAGKTTAMRMLLGLTRPSAGSASVLGHDVVHDTLAVRRVAGYLPAAYSLPPDMTGREFLQYIAAMFTIPRDIAAARAETLLRRFELLRDADRKLRGYSTGMTQKIGLAQALINEPKVLFLDEPTSGLDPLGRHELLEHLAQLARDKHVTVVFSSHILSDVETICRRVATLHHGRLIACGEIDALKREHGAATMDDLYLTLVRKEGA
jgi:ABC-2 type transport system ATP-binding protein